MLFTKISKECTKRAVIAFANVLKKDITFNSQFCIEGTVGITIDKDQVFLIHFDELFPRSNVSLNPLENIVDFENPTLELITLSPDHPGFDDANSPFMPSELNSSLNSFDYSKMMRGPLNADSKLPSTLDLSIPIDSDDSNDCLEANDPKPITGTDLYKPVLRISKKDYKNVKKIPKLRTVARTKHKALGRILTMQSNVLDHSGYALTQKRYLNRSKEECGSLDNKAEPNNDLTNKEHIPSGYICDVCNETFTRLGRLESHLVTKHGIVENEKLGKITHFPCQFCKKIYRFQAELDKHNVSHKSERPFHCLFCRNTYRRAETLSLHVQVHSGQLTCTPCNKVYQSKLHFQKHLVYMHEKLDLQ